MIRQTRSGEPIWIELCATDPAAAAEFYAAVFGWTTREERIGRSIYRMCSLDGRDVAGISDAGTLHAGRAHGWITYFAVDDVSASADSAVASGGEILTPPRHLPAAGLGAVVMDPFGAAFGLYRGQARSGIEAINVAGALCWNELQTSSADAALSFYGALFDAQPRHAQTSDGRPYLILLVGDRPIAGMLELEGDPLAPLPAAWITYLGVSDLDASVSRAIDAGGSAGIGPLDSPYGRLQLIRDSEGHTVCLVQLEEGLLPSIPSAAAEEGRS